MDEIQSVQVHDIHMEVCQCPFHCELMLLLERAPGTIIELRRKRRCRQQKTGTVRAFWREDQGSMASAHQCFVNRRKDLFSATRSSEGHMGQWITDTQHGQAHGFSARFARVSAAICRQRSPVMGQPRFSYHSLPECGGIEKSYAGTGRKRSGPTAKPDKTTCCEI